MHRCDYVLDNYSECGRESRWEASARLHMSTRWKRYAACDRHRFAISGDLAFMGVATECYPIDDAAAMVKARQAADIAYLEHEVDERLRGAWARAGRLSPGPWQARAEVRLGRSRAVGFSRCSRDRDESGRAPHWCSVPCHE